MDTAEIVDAAEELLAYYREVLLVDRYFSIKIEIAEGDFISYCEADSSPLSWIVTLNPARHMDVKDIQLSILEGILTVLFEVLDDQDSEKRKTAQKGLIARLRDAIAELPFTGDDEEEHEPIGENPF